ncbi:MAG: hypothetical protein U0441_17490 [Polyangiaceae bacterium]
MIRLRTCLSAAALLATAAFGFGCVAKEPVQNEEEIGAAAQAVDEDLGAPAGVDDGVVAPPDAIAVDENQANFGKPLWPGEPVPKLCGTVWTELPPGTLVWKQPDGTAGYKLPPGYVSIETDSGEAGSDDGASAMATGGGSLGCHCQSGEGTCSLHIGSNPGCWVDPGCAQCVSDGPKAILHLDAGLQFASAAEVTGLPPVTPTLLKVPLVADAFEQFKAQVAADAGLAGPEELDGPETGDLAGEHTFVAAPGWVLAAINVYGHLALISVPETYAAQAAVAWGSSQKCSCSSGSGCTAGSMLGAKYCDAGGCGSCTMTLSAAAGDVSLMSVNETVVCGP